MKEIIHHLTARLSEIDLFQGKDDPANQNLPLLKAVFASLICFIIVMLISRQWFLAVGIPPPIAFMILHKNHWRPERPQADRCIVNIVFSFVALAVAGLLVAWMAIIVTIFANALATDTGPG